MYNKQHWGTRRWKEAKSTPKTKLLKELKEGLLPRLVGRIKPRYLPFDFLFLEGISLAIETIDRINPEFDIDWYKRNEIYNYLESHGYNYLVEFSNNHRLSDELRNIDAEIKELRE